MTHLRSLLATMAAIIFMAAGVIGTAPPAQADSRCDAYELCLYWGSNLSGAMQDFNSQVTDFAPHTFFAPCCTWRPGSVNL